MMMKRKDVFNMAARMLGTLKEELHVLRNRLHRDTMTYSQQVLYADIEILMESEKAELDKKVTFVVPANANSKDLEKVKRQFKLEGWWPLEFVTGGNSGGTSPGVNDTLKP